MFNQTAPTVTRGRQILPTQYLMFFNDTWKPLSIKGPLATIKI